MHFLSLLYWNVSDYQYCTVVQTICGLGQDSKASMVWIFLLIILYKTITISTSWISLSANLDITKFTIQNSSNQTTSTHITPPHITLTLVACHSQMSSSVVASADRWQCGNETVILLVLVFSVIVIFHMWWWIRRLNRHLLWSSNVEFWRPLGKTPRRKIINW